MASVVVAVEQIVADPDPAHRRPAPCRPGTVMSDVDAEHLAHIDGRVGQVGNVEVDLAHHLSKAWLKKSLRAIFSYPILL
jgi:hypothetical protein